MSLMEDTLQALPVVEEGEFEEVGKLLSYADRS